MTLKEELEILRGESIGIRMGNAMDIPSIETSDAEKLCKHPVVSVHMLAYNHEPYIRQAIDGVMMQKTDFEFELVIGEDCSKDKTREICFEYQKKYPDKIRVLWWHENLGKVRHPAGSNIDRTSAHCRGEFIAFCEGDDYWIDPLKLQKQVDIMRANPSVGLCFCGAKLYFQQSGNYKNWECDAFHGGIIAGRLFMLYTIFGANPKKTRGPEGFVMTAGLLVRASVFTQAIHDFEVFNFRLPVADTTIVLGCGAISDVYYLVDQVSVYRITQTGAMATNGTRVMLDSTLIRIYFARKVLQYKYIEMPVKFIQEYFGKFFKSVMGKPRIDKSEAFLRLTRIRDIKGWLLSTRFSPMFICGLMGFVNSLTQRVVFKWCSLFKASKLSKKLVRDYMELGAEI